MGNPPRYRPASRFVFTAHLRPPRGWVRTCLASLLLALTACTHPSGTASRQAGMAVPPPRTVNTSQAPSKPLVSAWPAAATVRAEARTTPTVESARPAAAASTQRVPIRTVTFTPAMKSAVVAAHPYLGPVLEDAEPWLGTPYVWGGASPGKALDCSNFTWLLLRDQPGSAYSRFLSTAAMSRLTASNGLRRLKDSENPRAGDLLVYGYYDHPDTRKGWHGHVVVLIDPTGQLTGQPGLTLGAHGGTVNATSYVVADGYDQDYFRTPNNALVSVLRPTNFE